MSVVQAAPVPAPHVGGWKVLLNNRYAILLFRLGLAGVFLLSSYGKLIDIERYSVDALYSFQIMPVWLAGIFGRIVPFIELLCALGLLGGVLTRLSALGVSLLSLSFFLAKFDVLVIQGRQIDCGCFGAIVETLASVTIYMDIPMLLMGLYIIFSTFGQRHWPGIGMFLPDKWKRKLSFVW